MQKSLEVKMNIDKQTSKNIKKLLFSLLVNFIIKKEQIIPKTTIDIKIIIIVKALVFGRIRLFLYT